MNKGFFSLFLVLSFISGLALLAEARSSQQRLFSESATELVSLSWLNLKRAEIELRIDSVIEKALNESANEMNFSPESIKKKIHEKISAELNELNGESNPAMQKEIRCRINSSEEFSNESIVFTEFIEAAYFIQFVFNGEESIRCEINSFEAKTTALLPKGYAKTKEGILIAWN